MAVSADNRLRTIEELLSVTTHTSFVFGEISDVRKGAHLFPIGRRRIVASFAFAFVLFGGVRKLRIVHASRCGCGAWRRCGPSSLPLRVAAGKQMLSLKQEQGERGGCDQN
jgi:hypothetical protein